MPQIVLACGSITQVSQEDYIFLVGYNWCKCAGYPGTRTKKKIVLMHNMIKERMGITEEVDHHNRDKLDNRRDNLRPVTRGANLQNKEKLIGFKGVSWDSVNRKWRARITHDGNCYDLGCYSSEKEAAQAYNVEALRLYGPGALLNQL